MKLFSVHFIRIFLALVALHSVIVGINLISFPPHWMTKFGFLPITENFFKVQGGVFHIVMAVAYLLAAWKPVEYRILIIFSITVKFIATIFLISYFILSDSTITILLSGVVDFLMGLILLIIFMRTEFTDRERIH